MDIKGNISGLKIQVIPEKSDIHLFFERPTELGNTCDASETVLNIWEKIQKIITDFSEFKQITFDFSQVTYIASAGLGLLANLCKRAKEANLEFVVSGVTPEIFNILQVCNFPQAMTIQ